jgi:hypothetical protein
VTPSRPDAGTRRRCCGLLVDLISLAEEPLLGSSPHFFAGNQILQKHDVPARPANLSFFFLHGSSRRLMFSAMDVLDDSENQKSIEPARIRRLA